MTARHVGRLATVVTMVASGGRARRRPGRRLDVRPQVLRRVQEAAPPPRKPFTWLDDASQTTTVFIPVLLGAGVILSGAAWVVERVGRFTGGSRLEQDLARRLDSLALPPGGFMGDEPPDPFSPSGTR